jgi:hypothetical protein
MSENIPVPNVEMSGRQLTAEEKAEFVSQLGEKNLLLEACAGTDTLEEARLQLDIGEILILLERAAPAWTLARMAFDIALKNESWQDAVEACNVLYQTGEEGALAALGMGVWLAVTFPVAPELTYAMLDHVITETPENSDDAAFSAMTVRYVIDLRAEEGEHENWGLLANDLIARVAARHSQVQNQQALDAWMDKLGLRDPRVFLPGLSEVVNALVADSWWFDRDALRDTLPE